MRSRNGNRPILYAICAITCTLSLLADDYLIGYRLTTKNTQSIQESLTISKAMLPCSGAPRAPLILLREDGESLDSLLIRERTLFLEYASAQEIRLKSNDAFTGIDVKTLQTLTVPTHCYAVEFNDRLVTITSYH